MLTEEQMGELRVAVSEMPDWRLASLIRSYEYVLRASVVLGYRTSDLDATIRVLYAEALVRDSAG